MPQTPEARLMQAIDLLEALLTREAGPETPDRLSELVDHLRRIDASLRRAASNLRDTAHRTPAPATAQDLEQLHWQMADGLAQMIETQRHMQDQISAIADLLGMPPAGHAQTG